MNYFPIPIALLAIGKPLPVDVWSATGTLLLRKGQPITSEEHREKLYAHKACATLPEALAWQRSYERMVHTLLRDGVDLQEIAKAHMPSEIHEGDYVVAQQLSGGWLDLQEVLRGILYQGGLALNPLPRLAGIEKKAMDLLQADADDSLFCLFQALTDDSIGYCATHALLCAVTCALTADKLRMTAVQRRTLVNAALTMNIAMARDQDSMARQNAAPTDAQRTLIRDHPEMGVVILRGFGVSDEEQLDIVRWHHAAKSLAGMPHTVESRRMLAMADGFIARMAARRSRSPLSPVKAVRAMVLGAEGDAIGVGSAMAQSVGFYPPGTYVQLANGDTAVSIQRGLRAHTPWVVSIIDKDGMPLANYHAKNTADPMYTIEKAVDFKTVKVAISLDKVRKARARLPKY